MSDEPARGKPVSPDSPATVWAQGLDEEILRRVSTAALLASQINAVAGGGKSSHQLYGLIHATSVVAATVVRADADHDAFLDQVVVALRAGFRIAMSHRQFLDAAEKTGHLEGRA